RRLQYSPAAVGWAAVGEEASVPPAAPRQVRRRKCPHHCLTVTQSSVKNFSPQYCCCWEGRMRHRSPLRLTSGSRRRGRIASSGVCVTLALLPSLWVSWQAPAARGVVLPALAILTLLLLLPRSRNEGEPGRGPKSGQTR